jgi:hypothetical protein
MERRKRNITTTNIKVDMIQHKLIRSSITHLEESDYKMINYHLNRKENMAKKYKLQIPDGQFH